MSGVEAWCRDKQTKLLNEDLRQLTLNEMKEHFGTLSHEQVNQIAHTFHLPLVFDCLNDTKTEQIDLACDVLTLCMSNLSLGESTKRYVTLLERALNHPMTNVKLMSLQELYRTVSNAETVTDLIKHESLIIALVLCVGDDQLSVAKLASNILITLAKTKLGLMHLLSPAVRQVFAETIAISDTVRFRIYEIIVEIALNSADSLNALIPTGLLSSLIAELDNNDVLLKLNVFELLSNLLASEHGLSFLEDQKAIDKIMMDLINMKEDEEPLADLILPGLLKFFGNLAYWQPKKTITKYPGAFDCLSRLIMSDNFQILAVAYDTLAHIVSTPEAKLTLNNLAIINIGAILGHICKGLCSLPTELLVRALVCIENMMRIPVESVNLECIVSKWYNDSKTDVLSRCVSYAANPFQDIRCAALNTLDAFAGHHWAQLLIKNQPGLIEFLLDRQIETGKQSKEIKYNIVKTLSTSCSVFADDTLNRLQRYVKEGPFYVQAITEIAIEGSS